MPALNVSEDVKSRLNMLLADAVVYHYKLHNYHWFVKGHRFEELHEKFEELYNNASKDLDEVAERVLSVGGEPLGTLAECLKISQLDEETGRPTPEEMLKNVIADLKMRHTTSMSTIEAAEGEGDRGTANLLDDMNDRIEKDLWMLESSLPRE